MVSSCNLNCLVSTVARSFNP